MLDISLVVLDLFTDSCGILSHQGYTQPGYSQMDYGAPSYGQEGSYQQSQGMSSGGLTVSRREDSAK